MECRRPHCAFLAEEQGLILIAEIYRIMSPEAFLPYRRAFAWLDANLEGGGPRARSTACYDYVPSNGKSRE
jgi:hypothetical protein